MAERAVSPTACTVATRNRLAQCRVLTASFLAHHPGGRVVVLLLDDPGRTVAGEPFEITRPDELELAPDELLRMASIYDAFELCCALKPWILERLLDTGAGVVLYLDTDLDIHSPLGEAAALAGQRGVVLTPHLTAPPPLDARVEPEERRLVGGVYNGGFLGVSAGATAFLSWWRARLARHCIPEYAEDQRWLGLVPALFDHAVLRDPGYNVAPWNTMSRRVEESGGRLTVDGSPLRFFHWSAFDPERPWLLSRLLEPLPHTLLSEQPALARLARDYAERLLAAGHEECSRIPYGFACMPDGTPLERERRRRYRAELLEAEGAGLPAPSPLVATAAMS